MDSKIETYLQTMESELGALEAEQRDSELREMRQHIEAIVARLVEGGLSQSEAVEAAIAQFGAARKVGRELQTARVKGESLVQTTKAVGSASLCFFVPYLFCSALQSWSPERTYLIQVMVFSIACLAVGKVAATLAPHTGKRAVLWVFGFLFALEPLEEFLNEIPYWLRGSGPGWIQFILHDWRNDLIPVLILLLMWLGATINSRRAQSRSLTRA